MPCEILNLMHILFTIGFTTFVAVCQKVKLIKAGPSTDYSSTDLQVTD